MQRSFNPFYVGSSPTGLIIILLYVYIYIYGKIWGRIYMWTETLSK